MSRPAVLSTSSGFPHLHAYPGAAVFAHGGQEDEAGLASALYRPAAAAAAGCCTGGTGATGGTAAVPLSFRPADLAGTVHYHDAAVAHHPHLDHRPAPPASAPAPLPQSMPSDPHPPAYMPSEDELAQLQKLSSEYEPEVSGPLVSERQPTSRITSEYATADPVYRAKTAVLPQKYSEYRTCRGDGHCGWRAIAFTYFEALQRLGDKHKFLEEVTRLTSLKNLLNSVGFQEDLYEDFAEETFNLLRTTGTALPVTDNGAALLATFNNQGTSMAIITHLKLLTSAWIQTHPDDFAPFILGQDLKQYCSTEIEPAVCELDNVGLNALVEALVKPAGLALEVMYLDRSQGEEMNVYRYDPDGASLQESPPTIRLLYRPGHYDILYKPEDFATSTAIPSPAAMANVYVGLANSTAEYIPQELPASRAMPELMSMIPSVVPAGFGFGQPQWPSFEFAAPSPFPALTMAPLNYTQIQQQVSAPQAPQPAPAAQKYPPPPREFPAAPLREYAQQPQQQQQQQSQNRDYTTSTDYQRATPIPLESPLPIPINRPLAIRRGEPFRPSAYELEPYFGASQPHHMPCQTSIFRNSHFNTAHYMNPDFQPEEWSPDQEYAPSHRGRNKSSSQ